MPHRFRLYLLTIGSLALLSACVTIDERRLLGWGGSDSDEMGFSDSVVTRMQDTAKLAGDHKFIGVSGKRIAVSTLTFENLMAAHIVSGEAGPNARMAEREGIEPLILYCGGARFDRREHGASVLFPLLQFGEGIVWDYPGQGLSDGEPTIADMRRAAADMAEWVDGIAEDRPLVVWGHSMGAVVCADIAQRSRHADLLVLETAFADAEEAARSVARSYFPFLRVRVTDEIASFDIAESLAGYDRPILLLGAGRDKYVPVEQQRALANALDIEGIDNRSYVEIPLAGHNDAKFWPEVEIAMREIYDAFGWDHERPDIEIRLERKP